MNQKAIVTGAVSGFVGALVVDLHAWSAAPDGQTFNWQKALGRWVAGAISGAMTGAGLGVVS